MDWWVDGTCVCLYVVGREGGDGGRLGGCEVGREVER